MNLVQSPVADDMVDVPVHRTQRRASWQLAVQTLRQSLNMLVPHNTTASSTLGAEPGADGSNGDGTQPADESKPEAPQVAVAVDMKRRRKPSVTLRLASGTDGTVLMAPQPSPIRTDIRAPSADAQPMSRKLLMQQIMRVETFDDSDVAPELRPAEPVAPAQPAVVAPTAAAEQTSHLKVPAASRRRLSAQGSARARRTSITSQLSLAMPAANLPFPVTSPPLDTTAAAPAVPAAEQSGYRKGRRFSESVWNMFSSTTPAQEAQSVDPVAHSEAMKHVEGAVHTVKSYRRFSIGVEQPLRQASVRKHLGEQPLAPLMLKKAALPDIVPANTSPVTVVPSMHATTAQHAVHDKVLDAAARSGVTMLEPFDNFRPPSMAPRPPVQRPRNLRRYSGPARGGEITVQ